TTNIDITEAGKIAYMDLWLDIERLDAGLSDSSNFIYSLTNTSANTPYDNPIVLGTFKGLGQGYKINLLNSNTNTEGEYTLWIWLDAKETSSTTMNQNFTLKLNGECRDENRQEPIEVPNIQDDLIPVKLTDNPIDGYQVTTISSTDPSWYNYGNKEWANAILVSSDARSKYLNTTGVPVLESDILAYFVWIPRYAYQIWTTDATTTTSPQEINIRWESGTSEYTNGLQVGEYRTHPAFWWDTDGDRQVDSGETISGIWVGKFETTGDDTIPKVKPNQTPLVSQTQSEQFATALKFSGASFVNNVVTSGTGKSSYGLTSNIDSHMMKNSEWGAVAYLSHSIYGINTEIRKNNYSYGEQTGCGASYALRNSADTVTTCVIPYGSGLVSYPQSTTGNITGIFDMSGGKWDRVMGNYANTEVNGGFDATAGTGFFAQLSNQKYYDLYPSDIFNGDVSTNVTKFSVATCSGHALYETKSWYGDAADFVTSTYPWFSRGGSYGNTSYTGAFYVSFHDGSAVTNNGFRVVLF
ncbi:MAG: hypothetical protein IJZ79_06740, partial [Bacilli bacterium]|nr:hypothetical protein [Bacilli bacterium]